MVRVSQLLFLFVVNAAAAFPQEELAEDSFADPNQLHEPSLLYDGTIQPVDNEAPTEKQNGLARLASWLCNSGTSNSDANQASEKNHRSVTKAGLWGPTSNGTSALSSWFQSFAEPIAKTPTTPEDVERKLSRGRSVAGVRGAGGQHQSALARHLN